MFGKLKEKLKNWFSKPEEEIEKPKKKTQKKEKISKPKETQKPKKQKHTKEDIEKERKTTEKILNKINQEIKTPEEKYEEVLEEKKSFFYRLKEKFQFKITEENFNEVFSELELLLLENNVSIEVVEKIQEELKSSLLGKTIDKNKLQETIKEKLKEILNSILLDPFDLIEKIKQKQGTFVILFFGINGSGKTTTIAKIANLLQKHKISCILAAGDTFRAASIEQLEQHAEKLKVKLIKSQYNADPASVAFDAIKHASSNHIKVVLIDTAGRMYTKQDLMREMEKISRISKPDLKIFIAEAITGNDATEQAKTFNESIGIDGIILSKADIDEKGGTTLSVSYVTKKPILFLGTGQEYKDLEKFNRKKIIESLRL